MHTPIAAGKLTDIAFDDDAKRITVAAKIVDDDEWRKVQEGVYTGFSQGGRYVKRWPDADSGLTRYTAEPHEISLVDLPCVPDATFDVVKDGMVEKRAFAVRRAEAGSTRLIADESIAERSTISTPTSASSRPREREKDAEEGVAMPDGSYPIRSAKDVENAVRDYYRSGEKPDVKAHIIARAKAIGAESALPDDWTETADKAAARLRFAGRARTRPMRWPRPPPPYASCVEARPRDGGKRTPAQGARRSHARAHGYEEAHRGARSPAAAGQGGAALR